MLYADNDRTEQKGKTSNPVVMESSEHWRLNLCILMKEPCERTCKPRPLKSFILRGPKTQKIYLNELDQFVKHDLKARFYIRYVDDFVIFHHSWKTLEEYRERIREFLEKLGLELHPIKCSIQPISHGISFLEFRECIFFAKEVGCVVLARACGSEQYLQSIR